jgi:hypothetical protein
MVGASVTKAQILRMVEGVEREYVYVVWRIWTGKVEDPLRNLMPVLNDVHRYVPWLGKQPGRFTWWWLSCGRHETQVV